MASPGTYERLAVLIIDACRQYILLVIIIMVRRRVDFQLTVLDCKRVHGLAPIYLYVDLD